MCEECKDRPYRDRDKGKFQEDVKSEWLKKLLDDDAQSGSPMDF